MVKRFVDLTNFQQWVLFYLIIHKSINANVENEINNFCDKTKNGINIDNYDQDMANLQKELLYFHDEKLIEQDAPNTFGLSKKGELYCFQNLKQNLIKLQLKKIMDIMTANNVYKTSKVLCDQIFSNYNSLKTISSLLIGNPKDTMTRIQVFVQIIRALSNIQT